MSTSDGKGPQQIGLMLVGLRTGDYMETSLLHGCVVHT